MMDPSSILSTASFSAARAVVQAPNVTRAQDWTVGRQLLAIGSGLVEDFAEHLIHALSEPDRRLNHLPKPAEDLTELGLVLAKDLPDSADMDCGQPPSELLLNRQTDTHTDTHTRTHRRRGTDGCSVRK